MDTMKEILQHLIFPDDYSLEDCRPLFYRGDFGRLTGLGKNATLQLSKCQWVEFCTYMNSFSYAKWKKYTHLESLTLTLEYAGEAEITVIGYSMKQNAACRKVFQRMTLSAGKRTSIDIPIPDNSETLVGFELSVINDFELFGGVYTGTFPDTAARNIELALLTTTFKREEYIRKNTLRMKEGLFDLYPEMASHVRMHVTDNGRTLSEKDLPDDPHFLLHPNPNAGGAGGYARGMIECLHQEPAATHGILLDDDIMILPDSIYRTYELLRFMKDEYTEHFIGGAMLLLEDKVHQHEDTGSIAPSSYFKPVKRQLFHQFLWDNIKNEEDVPVPNKFQAWWYCCIPVTVMRKYGLPLPVFIRGDDAEYSLRCKAQIITMNGICLWHMGFDGKFTSSLCAYQEKRNLMIAQSVSGVLPEIDFFGIFKITFRACVLRRDYASAELTLKMLEDYLKGPEFLKIDQGEKIMKENGAINEKLVPLEEIDVPGFDMRDDPDLDEKRDLKNTFRYRLTWNGNRLCPDRWLRNKPTSIPIGTVKYRPGKMAMRRTIVAVDVFNHTGVVRTIDKERYKALKKRYRSVVALYERTHEQVREEYRAQGDYLKSEEFWRKYLKMD